MSVENPLATLPAPLADRRTGFVRRKECVCRGILCVPHWQRFGCRDPGGAVCHGSEGKRLRRGRGYHLDACRNLQLHESNHAFEERNIGHQSHEDLGIYGRGACSRLLELLIGQRVVGQASNHRDRELDASEGARDRQRQGRVQWLPLLLHASPKNASNNTFELLNIHNGFGPGFFVDTGTGGNLVLNCDSHDNYDVNGSQGDGQNGDGFGVGYKPPAPTPSSAAAAHGTTPMKGTTPSRKRSQSRWRITGPSNADTAPPEMATGSRWGAARPAFGILYKTTLPGVTRRRASTPTTLREATPGHNTSYNNGTQYDMLASSFDSSGNVTGTITLTGSKAHIMRNNIGFPDKNSNMDGVDTQFNTWDLNITPTTADFASTSDTPCTGSREADGSMPAACTMLHLAAGSKMIDKGTNVGLPYAGTAPDLGAYEYGAATTTGGTSGSSGGSTGAGGAGGSTSAGGTPLGVAASLAAAASAAAPASAAARAPAVAQSAAAARATAAARAPAGVCASAAARAPAATQSAAAAWRPAAAPVAAGRRRRGQLKPQEV